MTRGAAKARWVRSFVYAARGIRLVWRHERNFRVQLAAGALALYAGALSGLSAKAMLLILTIVTVVLTAETLNTSLESMVDLVSPEHHALAEAAKDLGAGAVLLSALGAFAIGLVLFLDHPLRHSAHALDAFRSHPLPSVMGLLALGWIVRLATKRMVPRRKR